MEQDYTNNLNAPVEVSPDAAPRTFADGTPWPEDAAFAWIFEDGDAEDKRYLSNEGDCYYWSPGSDRWFWLAGVAQPIVDHLSSQSKELELCRKALEGLHNRMIQLGYSGDHETMKAANEVLRAALKGVSL